MKYAIILIFLSFNLLHAVTLTVNKAREENASVTIVHIVNDRPFRCEKSLRDDFKKSVVCRFSPPLQDHIDRKEEDIEIRTRPEGLELLPAGVVHLYAVPTGLVGVQEVAYGEDGPSRHWIVVASEKPLSLFETDEEEGLHFAIPFAQKMPPHVGTLDIDAKPLQHSKIADAIKKLKELYRKKMYPNVINSANILLSDEINRYNSEIWLYKLRAEDARNWASHEAMTAENGQQTIEDANEWIRLFPSDAHLQEVLAIMVHTYLGLGHMKEAQRIIDTLKKEFPDSAQTQKALIYLGDRLTKTNKRNEAIKIYEEIYYGTKDLQIASLAAERLAQLYLAENRPEKAAEYLRKILKANPDYLKNDPKASFEMARKLAKKKQYPIAIEIADKIEDALQDRALKERLCKERAFWLEQAGRYEEAREAYRTYLKRYTHGRFKAFVQEHLQKLLLDTKESNLTKRLAFLDEMMLKYPKEEKIYAKALAQKARILLDLGRYDEVVRVGEQLRAHHLEKMLQEAVAGAFRIDITKKRCTEAIHLYDTYHPQVDSNATDVLFACFLRSMAYDKAYKLAKSMSETTGIKERGFWLSRLAHIAFLMGRYQEVVQIADDMRKIEALEGGRYYERTLYEAARSYYLMGGHEEEFIKSVSEIEKRFPDKLTNLDLYADLLKIAKKRRDDALLIATARKMIALQRRYHIATYTPQTELEYIEALKRLGRYAEALRVDIDLLYAKLTDAQRAQVLFEAGDLSMKLGKKEEAKAFFRKCGEIVNDTAWVSLCAQSLKLLEE